MDSLYSASQPFAMYEHRQWSEDAKPAFVGDGHDHTLDDKIADSNHSVNSSSASTSRRPSMLKVEDDFSATAPSVTGPSTQMWQDRPQDVQPIRSFSTSHASVMNGAGPSFSRVSDSAFNPTIQHANTWSISHSGSSTPTPMFGQIYEMPYTHPTTSFSTYPNDPTSAISMSPQSSQGGWASAASSDGIEQRGMISPMYRPTSPGTVMRPDGIRKKNARFEIPKERNLANIDAMILASTDENEKKELKQQKRLLRNRQAALDSRQRKKTHTEKLEQEKKVAEKKMFDLEEALARLESTLAMEREQFLQQRQHMENVVHALQYERDEAIRTKTLETAELRRRNLVLEDCIKEMDGQHQRGYPPSGSLNDYDDGYNSLGFGNNLEDEEFSLINGDDWKMDDSEQRQATPRPLPPPAAKPTDLKTETGFSWTTFYMCLLFGAFIASNNNSAKMGDNAASAIASSIPSAEASNVLKTVLSSGGVDTHGHSMDTEPSANIGLNGIDNGHQARVDSNIDSSSSLDHLSHSLSTPSRRQEMAAAFSMSASAYQHLTDPFNDGLGIDDESELLDPPPPPQPSALQKAFANMQAQKDNLDKITGMGSKARERSLLWDQVPPEVIKNFEALVQRSANTKLSSNVKSMEQ